MDYENRILHGTSLDVLKKLPDEVFDSFVSDVPYGIGDRQPTVEEIVAYLQGADLDTGGDFMGADWEIPSVPVWKEVFRVLKPGAYVLCFGGTRTFDIISLGIRAAGFECRDTIADEFPAVELPILQWIYGEGMPKSHNLSKAFEKCDAPEEAKEWSGFGTGLKPSWEPILVFRKPFKGTLVDNVLKHRTGALNIDASRVKHSSEADFEAHKKGVDATRTKGGVRGNSWKNASDLSGANEVKAEGRWPANVMLTHSSTCADVCVPGCPVAELDAQSGNRPSTLTGRADPGSKHMHPGTQFNPNSTFLGERTHHSPVYADSGGASRFFAKFDGVPFRYVSKASRKEAGCGEFKVEHPTLKPLKLMCYLVRLVTPPGGTVLDAYCGSATTCHAAVLEGFRYTGIEKYETPWKEAVRRMEVVHRKQEEERHEKDLFELAMEEV